jgi:DHA1 family bicyclomycin/chloramphenicol resistance-like MFS transporter
VLHRATSDGGATFVPGTRAFTVVLSLAMATTALSIDSLLPAFGDIRRHLGLADDSTAVAGLITAFIIGNSLGLLPAGLLADRVGRRPVMWGGFALFILGAVGAALAPTLWLMLVSRFVWGLGAAGPRVAALAMVRDVAEGEQMARQMSAIMAIFILVPAFAPTISTGLLAIGPWQLVFWMCAVAAAAVVGLSFRLPATLPTTDRQPFRAGDVGRSCRAVLSTPGTVGYLVALSALFAAFLSYLGSSEIILDEVFGLGTWFPVVFGVLALTMGAGMFVNGRIVERVGLDRLVRRLHVGYVTAAVGLLGVTVIADGTPPFVLFAPLLAGVLVCHGVLIPNVNSAAMRPLADVAGTGAALLGMIPGVLGAIVGNAIDRAFDGTVTPFSIGFVGSGAVAMVATRRAADRQSGRRVTGVAPVA